MTTHLWACPCGGLAHAEHRLVLGTIQPTNREAGAADPSHHGDVAVSKEAMRKMIHGEKIGKWCERMEKYRSSEGERNLDTLSFLTGGVSSLQGFAVFTFTEMYYLALRESGGIISRVWAGPYRFTTNRLTEGILEPACEHKKRGKKSNLSVNFGKSF